MSFAITNDDLLGNIQDGKQQVQIHNPNVLLVFAIQIITYIKVSNFSEKSTNWLIMIMSVVSGSKMQIRPT